MKDGERREGCQWREFGTWLVSGGVRVDMIDTSERPELVIRYQEREFFTQVRLPFERLREMAERVGWELSIVPSKEVRRVR